MPLRYLRPGLRNSKRFNRLPYFEQSLFARLITLVDDFGRYEADPDLLKSEAFPYGDPQGQPVNAQTIDGGLRTIADKGMAVLYQSDGKQYLQLLRWQERTRSKSKFPEPKASDLLTSADNCAQLQASPPYCLTPSPTPTPSPDAGNCRHQPVNPSPQPAAGQEKSVCVDLKKLIPDKRARTNGDGSGVVDLTQRLNGLYHRPETDPWTYEEQHLCAEISQRPNWSVEWDTLLKFRRSLREKRWFPQSIAALLSGWTAQIDKARLAERNPSMRGE